MTIIMILKLSTLLALSFCTTAVANNTASALPNTDIFLAQLNQNKVINIENISKRVGYDNQPSFTENGVLYTAAFKNKQQWQTDTLFYSFDTKKTINLTNTPESEYSPTKLPAEPGFSVILEGLDASQELWSYTFDGEQPRKPLRKEKGKIGYHAWGLNNDLVTFVLGQPHALYFGNTDKQTGRAVAYDIGRSLAFNQSINQYSFSQYKDEDQWINLYNSVTDQVTPLIELPKGVDYYAWQGDEHLIFAKGSTIYRWKLGSKSKPALWLDVSHHCKTNITRLKYQTTSQKLVFVCDMAV